MIFFTDAPKELDFGFTKTLDTEDQYRKIEIAANPDRISFQCKIYKNKGFSITEEKPLKKKKKKSKD
jgi:hypothetical protein